MFKTKELGEGGVGFIVFFVEGAVKRGMDCVL